MVWSRKDKSKIYEDENMKNKEKKNNNKLEGEKQKAMKYIHVGFL